MDALFINYKSEDSENIRVENGNFPSSIYNPATSDKCNILSPWMIIQMMKEFEILPPSAVYPYPEGFQTHTSGYHAAATSWEVYYHTMHAVLIGVIQEELRSISVPKHHLLNTSILSRLNNPDLAVGKNNSVNTKGIKVGNMNRMASSNNTNNINNTTSLHSSEDILPVTQMPVPIIVQFVNFVVFQKV